MNQAVIAILVSSVMLTSPKVSAQSIEKPYSPYVGRDYPTNVYFGDTHLHTRLSLDAYGDGNTKNGPAEVYRWARGEEIAGDDGVPTRISRPLDFLMVSDHGEYMGLVPALAKGKEQLRATEEGARCGKMIDESRLLAGWTDPDFNPSVSAFYYTRVIEIPTPRWPVFDEVRFGIKMGPEVKRVLQERAYTSPIWYSP